MSLGIAGSRLMQERKNWRKEHPAGWYARPMSKSDGSTSLMKWECGIKGPEHTSWEGGLYKVVLEFTEDYPTKPPTCKFVPPLFHPNVYASGKICLSIINDGGDWKPAITIKQILIGIRDLLDAPNTADPANGQASRMFVNQRAEYDELVRAEAKKNAP